MNGLLNAYMQGMKRRGGLAYYQKAINLAPANLIGYWRLNETTGTAAVDSSTQANNGAYTGVDLANTAGPDGVAVPRWDGANDTCNIYSVGLNGDFSGNELTVAGWAKVSAAGVWTDATARQAIVLSVDASNFISIRRSTTNNKFRFNRRGGGAPGDKSYEATVSTTGWFHWALVTSDAGDYEKYYINGAQVGTTQSTIGTWSGALSATACNIGSSSSTPAGVWSGWLAHVTIFNTPLTDPQILALATV